MNDTHQRNGQAAQSLPPSSPPPAPIPPADALRAILRRLAGQVLAEAATLPAPDRPVVVVASDETLTLTIVAADAASKEGRPLTPCERDILAVLETATCRITMSRMCAELDRRGMVHGDSTVHRTLSHLSKLGIIQANTSAPRGYQLPGKRLPLWGVEGQP